MNSIKKMFVVAVAALSLASCSDDQTTFDLENVPGRALVQGVVNCNYGATNAGGKFEYEIKPVANLKVLLTINNSEYKDGLTGETVLETVTNDKGEYSFEVPVTTKGITASITTAQFTGVRTVVERKNNKVVSTEQNVAFGTTAPVQVSLANYGIEYANVMCDVTSIDQSVDTYTNYARIQGKIGRNVERYTAPEPQYDEWSGNFTGISDGTVSHLFEPAPQADLILNVIYHDKEYVFNATTDSRGMFNIEVPVIEFPADISYRIEVMPVETTFTTYVRDLEDSQISYNGSTYWARCWTGYQMKGMYEQTNWTMGERYVSYPAASFYEAFEMKALVFKPYQDEDTQNYLNYNWSDNTPWENDEDLN